MSLNLEDGSLLLPEGPLSNLIVENEHTSKVTHYLLSS